MTNIVIPVKNPSSAKQRLGDVLTPDQRRELALAMLDHVVEQTSAAALPHHILVVTDSAEIESRVRPRGVSILLEERARGETEAVEEATRWSIRNEFERQLVIPADMPNLTSADIDTLLSEPAPKPSVVLSPAVGDDGTNAILTSPPDAITFRFGRRSFPDYVEQARRRNIACKILRLPNLVLDLDSFEDVKQFLDQTTAMDGQVSNGTGMSTVRPAAGPLFRLLSGWNLRERVN